MTREEAINLLNQIKFFFDHTRKRGRYSEQLAKALGVAIESLQTDIVRCKDCRHWQSADEEKENGTFVNRDNWNFNCNDSNRALVDVPSGDFVIRDAVVDTILKTYTRLKGHPTANHLIENIDALPGADKPQGEDWDKYSEKLWRLAYERGLNARPKGEWIENDALGWKCSKCGIITNLESNFCPCCGARMKGGAE